MPHEEHEQIVRRHYDEVFAHEFVGHSASDGTYTLADMRRDIEREHEAMPDDETIVEEQMAEGNRVVTRWRYRWKHDQSLFGESLTAQWLTMHGMHIERVVSGRMWKDGKPRIPGAS